MVLTEFVKFPQVQERFNTEFNPVFDNRYKPKIYSKTDGKPKQNIGIHFEILDDNTKLFCDSLGREQLISSIKELIKFFTFSKYRNELCWFYDPTFDLKKIMNFLPEQQLNELETTRTTQFYVYKIDHKVKNFFQIRTNRTNYYRFHNLYPFFNMSLGDATKKYLNYPDVNQKFCKISKKIVDNWHDNSDILSNNSHDTARIIQKLAQYSTNNDNDQTPISFKKMVNAPKTRNYTLVGTAFDYLLRFLIKAHNPNAVTQPWRAERALEVLKGEEKKMAKSIIKNAKKHVDRFLREKNINDDIIVSSLLLAKLDGIFWGSDFENIDWDVDPADVDDIRNLINGVPDSLYIAKKHCFLNPTFGLATYLVDGADADLLIDGTLIDIKTTKDPKFTSRFFNQLMGYVILHHLGRLYSKNIKSVVPAGFESQFENDPDNHFLNSKIEKIGVYFSRFNYLYTIDLKDVLPEGKTNLKLSTWFEAEAHKIYKPKIMGIKKMKKFYK